MLSRASRAQDKAFTYLIRPSRPLSDIQSGIALRLPPHSKSNGPRLVLAKRNTKECAEVFRRGTGNVLKVSIVNGGQTARRLDHACRFVTFPTKRNGGEVWTVSLNQQT